MYFNERCIILLSWKNIDHKKHGRIINRRALLREYRFAWQMNNLANIKDIQLHVLKLDDKILMQKWLPLQDNDY